MPTPSRTVGFQNIVNDWVGQPAREPLPAASVHKERSENVLLSRVAAIQDREHEFIAQLWVQPDHSFFFEHAIDHVPGLMLIEAARQMGVAVSHEYYGIPQDHAFLLKGLKCEFSRLAELDIPVFIHGLTHDHVLRAGRTTGMTFTGTFMQDENVLGSMSSAWQTVSPAVWARTRRKC